MIKFFKLNTILKNKILIYATLIMKEGIAFLFVFALGTATLYAQPGSGEDGAVVDTTANYDYYDENIDGSDMAGGEKKEEKKEEKKPYVRIKVPVDTLTELITYEEVILQDASYYDSLYLRAKRWINTNWGVANATKKNDVKKNEKLYSDDVLYEKFKAKVSVPLRVRYNKYSSSDYGQLQFTINMRFKDGRYKYTITNLVHLLPETSAEKDINYVYMEFYMKSEKNVATFDRYLRAADGSIQKLIKELQKYMREPIEKDEDDW